MSFIINIETSTKVCSVALSKDGGLVNIHEIKDDKYVHAEKLTLLIQLSLKEAKIKFNELSNNIYKFINLKEFNKYKLIKPKKIEDIEKLNKNVRLKINQFCI